MMLLYLLGCVTFSVPEPVTDDTEPPLVEDSGDTDIETTGPDTGIDTVDAARAMTTIGLSHREPIRPRMLLLVDR